MTPLRVAYLSHSLCADRQVFFSTALLRELRKSGGDLLELYPERWGSHHRSGGWPVANEGDMTQYLLPLAAWEHLAAWRPDVLLLQQEAYCLISQKALDWCRSHKVPLVTFSWENAASPPEHALAVLRGAALNIFGNSDAKRLADDEGVSVPSVILPQVGVEDTLFRAEPTTAQYDIAFMGRKDPMKGADMLDRAAAGQGFRVWKQYQAAGRAPYEAMPEAYRRARVQCVPSHDVEGLPREQWAPATTVEGLMCGVPVVTTNQAAIVEWTRSGSYITGPCPAAWWARQGDAMSLRIALHAAMLEYVNNPVKFRDKGLAGRAWAKQNFSNAKVAAEYATVLQRVVEGWTA